MGATRWRYVLIALVTVVVLGGGLSRTIRILVEQPAYTLVRYFEEVRGYRRGRGYWQTQGGGRRRIPPEDYIFGKFSPENRDDDASLSPIGGRVMESALCHALKLHIGGPAETKQPFCKACLSSG
jgi:hypothetical protein